MGFDKKSDTLGSDGAEGEVPYYAIMNDENQKLYEKYLGLTAGMNRFHLLGRLAEYKYYIST